MNYKRQDDWTNPDWVISHYERKIKFMELFYGLSGFVIAFITFCCGMAVAQM